VAKTAEVRKWTEVEGKRLRDKRIERGLNQGDAAAVLKVSDDTLRNWEKGKTEPREGYLADLAKFCGTTVEELYGAFEEGGSSASNPPSPAADVNAPPGKPAGFLRKRVVAVLFVAAVTVVALAIGTVVWRERNAAFSEIRNLDDGIAGVSRSGKVLWKVGGVAPLEEDRWAFVRMPGGKRVVACVLARSGDFRLETVRTLSLIAADAPGPRIRTVTLPIDASADLFPNYSRRYYLASISAVDLDGDGVDEILVTYQQVPECVSFTVLYEPVTDQSRVLFVHTGGHHFTGAYDLDGDGKKELLFLCINNAYNWVNALAAIRLKTWSGPSADDAPVFSPDSTTYVPNEPALVFYALLPRDKAPHDPGAVSWDAGRRALTLRFMSGRKITLDSLGFVLSKTFAVPERQREAFRREAGEHDRESRRLTLAGRYDDALAENRLAVAAAERSGDSTLLEVMKRGLGKALIAAGRTAEGEALLRSLANQSESASEIYYDAAVAFHLRGDLDRAVEFYEAGIGRGGNPEAGKDKHEFIQNEVLALVEKGAYAEALRAIDRFCRRYPHIAHERAVYEEFVHWRKGEIPHPERIDVPLNATDLLRYWMLEFRNAAGEKPAALLPQVDVLIAERNQPFAALLSLRAELLSRLGRRAESETAGAEAAAVSREEAKVSVVSRAHVAVIESRLSPPRAPSQQSPVP
jgi:transcriptional regulator with XRE-family HTH domain/tetratricopeptide (TPR) repeat protein